MTVFLNYRDKYYGVSASSDKTALATYQNSGYITSLKAKLLEYKTWWASNKDGFVRSLLMKMKVK